MFSGIVETVSPILNIQDAPGHRILSIRRPPGWRLRAGDSVCVDGVCSTVQKTNGRVFRVTYMPETLRRTTLGGLRPMDFVNLERSLRLNSFVGGHLVQGHVDTTAQIRSISGNGEAKIYEFEVPTRYSRYIVEKGSISVHGVSLTVVRAGPGRLTVSLLAYTLSHTTLGRKGPGDRVNIEVDLVAKYLEKLTRG